MPDSWRSVKCDQMSLGWDHDPQLVNPNDSEHYGLGTEFAVIGLNWGHSTLGVGHLWENTLGRGYLAPGLRLGEA